MAANVPAMNPQAEALAWSVGRGPLDIEREFPYHPHVTIAHHLADDVLDRAFAELADFDATSTTVALLETCFRQVELSQPEQGFEMTMTP